MCTKIYVCIEMAEAFTFDEKFGVSNNVMDSSRHAIFSVRITTRRAHNDKKLTNPPVETSNETTNFEHFMVRPLDSCHFHFTDK